MRKRSKQTPNWYRYRVSGVTKVNGVTTHHDMEWTTTRSLPAVKSHVHSIYGRTGSIQLLEEQRNSTEVMK